MSCPQACDGPGQVEPDFNDALLDKQGEVVLAPHPGRRTTFRAKSTPMPRCRDSTIQVTASGSGRLRPGFQSSVSLGVSPTIFLGTFEDNRPKRVLAKVIGE